MAALRAPTPLPDDFWRHIADEFDPDNVYIGALRVAVEGSPSHTVYTTATDNSLRADTALFFCTAFYGAVEHPQWPVAFKDPANAQMFLTAVRNARRTVLQTPAEGWFPPGETHASFAIKREEVVGLKNWVPEAAKHLMRKAAVLNLFTYGIADKDLLQLVIRQMKKLLYDKPHWAEQKRHNRAILQQQEKQLADDRAKFLQEVKERNDELAERERKLLEVSAVQTTSAIAIAVAATENATEMMKARIAGSKRERELHAAQEPFRAETQLTGQRAFLF